MTHVGAIGISSAMSQMRIIRSWLPLTNFFPSALKAIATDTA
jgi:hypothetical protein